VGSRRRRTKCQIGFAVSYLSGDETHWLIGLLFAVAFFALMLAIPAVVMLTATEEKGEEHAKPDTIHPDAN
jgi:hypothetical protein